MDLPAVWSLDDAYAGVRVLVNGLPGPLHDDFGVLSSPSVTHVGPIVNTPAVSAYGCAVFRC